MNPPAQGCEQPTADLGRGYDRNDENRKLARGGSTKSTRRCREKGERALRRDVQRLRPEVTAQRLQAVGAAAQRRLHLANVMRPTREETVPAHLPRRQPLPHPPPHLH